MRRLRQACGSAALVALFLAGWLPARADVPVGERGALQVTGARKEYLTNEPILVTARLLTASPQWRLPPGPGKNAAGTLHFEVTPAVKERPGARPLPFEPVQSSGSRRVYDLLECLQFPAEGTFTVRLVLQQGGGRLKSDPVTFTLRRPGKGDAEEGPVGRLHHLPWSNYVENAFCGDTFDLVKTWPNSRLARYAHFWNGLHCQHKKEYDKAIASYRIVLTRYPDFVLAEPARRAVAQCEAARAAASAAGSAKAAGGER
jgi:hypothetical protein